MLSVAQATGRVAHIPPSVLRDVYSHQNDTCVIRFAVAAVMLKPCTQRLAMLMPSPAAASLGMLLVRLEIIATTYRSTIFKTYAFRLYSHLCIYVSI